MIAIDIPKSAQLCLNILENAGFKAFLVGGFVRDFLLGNRSNPYGICRNQDIDIASDATPEQVCRLFNEYKVMHTGVKYGTVTVIIECRKFEITSFRAEEGYTDSRHPDKVRFISSLEEDLSRRDFTINAAAYNPSSGFTDIFGAAADMEKGVLRCIGDPQLRFSEDPLRILRGIRFISCLRTPNGAFFSADENTKSGMFAAKEKLTDISPERVSSELFKILLGENVRRTVLEFFEIMCVILPELRPMYKFKQNNKYHIYDVLEHSLAAVESIKNDPILKLSALLHDAGKPYCYSRDSHRVGHFYGHAQKSAEISSEILNRLRLSTKVKKRVINVIKYHNTPVLPNERQLSDVSQCPDADAFIRRWLRDIGYQSFCDLICMKIADNSAKCPSCLKRNAVLNDILEIAEYENSPQRRCFSLSHLAVNGTDIKILGVPEGPAVGRILDKLMLLVTEGNLKNNRSELLGYAENYLIPKNQ